MNGILVPAEPAPTTVAPVTTTKPNGGKMPYKVNLMKNRLVNSYI